MNEYVIDAGASLLFARPYPDPSVLRTVATMCGRNCEIQVLESHFFLRIAFAVRCPLGFRAVLLPCSLDGCLLMRPWRVEAAEPWHRVRAERFINTSLDYADF